MYPLLIFEKPLKEEPSLNSDLIRTYTYTHTHIYIQYIYLYMQGKSEGYHQSDYICQKKRNFFYTFYYLILFE
jgi:hypothetical protein